MTWEEQTYNFLENWKFIETITHKSYTGNDVRTIKKLAKIWSLSVEFSYVQPTIELYSL